MKTSEFRVNSDPIPRDVAELFKTLPLDSIRQTLETMRKDVRSNENAIASLMRSKYSELLEGASIVEAIDRDAASLGSTLTDENNWEDAASPSPTTPVEAPSRPQPPACVSHYLPSLECVPAGILALLRHRCFLHAALLDVAGRIAARDMCRSLSASASTAVELDGQGQGRGQGQGHQEGRSALSAAIDPHNKASKASPSAELVGASRVANALVSIVRNLAALRKQTRAAVAATLRARPSLRDARDSSSHNEPSTSGSETASRRMHASEELRDCLCALWVITTAESPGAPDSHAGAKALATLYLTELHSALRSALRGSDTGLANSTAPVATDSDAVATESVGAVRHVVSAITSYYALFVKVTTALPPPLSLGAPASAVPASSTSSAVPHRAATNREHALAILAATVPLLGPVSRTPSAQSGGFGLTGSLLPSGRQLPPRALRAASILMDRLKDVENHISTLASEGRSDELFDGSAWNLSELLSDLSVGLERWFSVIPSSSGVASLYVRLSKELQVFERTSEDERVPIASRLWDYKAAQQLLIDAVQRKSRLLLQSMFEGCQSRVMSVLESLKTDLVSDDVCRPFGGLTVAAAALRRLTSTSTPTECTTGAAIPAATDNVTATVSVVLGRFRKLQMSSRDLADDRQFDTAPPVLREPLCVIVTVLSELLTGLSAFWSPASTATKGSRAPSSSPTDSALTQDVLPLIQQGLKALFECLGENLEKLRTAIDSIHPLAPPPPLLTLAGVDRCGALTEVDSNGLVDRVRACIADANAAQKPFHGRLLFGSLCGLVLDASQRLVAAFVEKHTLDIDFSATWLRLIDLRCKACDEYVGYIASDVFCRPLLKSTLAPSWMTSLPLDELVLGESPCLEPSAGIIEALVSSRAACTAPPHHRDVAASLFLLGRVSDVAASCICRVWSAHIDEGGYTSRGTWQRTFDLRFIGAVCLAADARIGVCNPFVTPVSISVGIAGRLASTTALTLNDVAMTAASDPIFNKVIVAPSRSIGTVISTALGRYVQVANKLEKLIDPVVLNVSGTPFAAAIAASLQQVALLLCPIIASQQAAPPPPSSAPKGHASALPECPRFPPLPVLPPTASSDSSKDPHAVAPPDPVKLLKQALLGENLDSLQRITSASHGQAISQMTRSTPSRMVR